MTLARVLSLTLLVGLLAADSADTNAFDLKVTRLRIPPRLRNQPGDLHIDANGVTFRSADGKANITIRMQDLRQADVADPHALRFETYEVPRWKPIERRAYTFRAQNDVPGDGERQAHHHAGGIAAQRHVEEIAQFLAPRIHRPIVGHYAAASQFQIAAYHRRALGGTNGTLEIAQDAIRFVSDKPADSRTSIYMKSKGRSDTTKRAGNTSDSDVTERYVARRSPCNVRLTSLRALRASGSSCVFSMRLGFLTIRDRDLGHYTRRRVKPPERVYLR